MLVDPSVNAAAAFVQGLGLILLALLALLYIALDNWNRSNEGKREAERRHQSLEDAERRAAEEWESYTKSQGWK